MACKTIIRHSGPKYLDFGHFFKKAEYSMKLFLLQTMSQSFLDGCSSLNVEQENKNKSKIMVLVIIFIFDSN